jgi:hypothetical protein
MGCFSQTVSILQYHIFGGFLRSGVTESGTVVGYQDSFRLGGVPVSLLAELGRLLSVHHTVLFSVEYCTVHNELQAT